MKVKIGENLLEAVVQTRPNDTAWNGRESKAVTFAGTYQEAVSLFHNDVKWSVIYEAAEDSEAVETDLSAFALAGPITDNRNGTITAKMGKYLQAEIISMTIGEAPKNHADATAVREAIEMAVQSLDDGTASAVVSLFPSLKHDGSLIKAGTRINWNGKIIRAAVDLWDREEHAPEKAPNLWEGLA